MPLLRSYVTLPLRHPRVRSLGAVSTTQFRVATIPRAATRPRNVATRRKPVETWRQSCRAPKGRLRRPIEKSHPQRIKKPARERTPGQVFGILESSGLLTNDDAGGRDHAAVTRQASRRISHRGRRHRSSVDRATLDRSRRSGIAVVVCAAAGIAGGLAAGRLAAGLRLAARQASPTATAAALLHATATHAAGLVADRLLAAGSFANRLLTDGLLTARLRATARLLAAAAMVQEAEQVVAATARFLAAGLRRAAGLFANRLTARLGASTRLGTASRCWITAGLCTTGRGTAAAVVPEHRIQQSTGHSLAAETDAHQRSKKHVPFHRATSP